MQTETTEIQPQPNAHEPGGSEAERHDGRGERPNGKRERSIGRTAAAIIIGGFGALLAVIGVAAIVAHTAVRDDDGYFTTDTELATGSYALATDRIELDEAGAEVPDALLGDFRVRATSDGSRPMFIGIAPTADVERYLGGVGHREVTDFDIDGDPQYENKPGRAPATRPGRQDFWVAQSQGTGQQQLDWKLRAGDWSVVAMNEDASRGLALDGDLGVHVGYLIWVGLGFLVVGLGSIAAAVALFVSASRRA